MNNTQLPFQKQVSEAFAKGDMTLAAPHLAADIRWNILGEVPVEGREEVLEVVKMTQLQSFPVITIHKVIAEGDFVVIESSGEAKTLSGQPYNQQYCDIFRFEGGMLQEITTYLDTALSRQSGATDPFS